METSRKPLSRLLPQIERNSHPEWRTEINQIMDQHPTDYIEEGTGLGGPWLVRALAEATEGRSTIVTGVGQHQMWAAQYYPYTKQRQWVTSGGLGTMGYEVPAAMGAQFAQQEPIWSICGDGGFQMTSQELQTVAEHNLPVRFAIFNNGFLGMVRQWQGIVLREQLSLG